MQAAEASGPSASARPADSRTSSARKVGIGCGSVLAILVVLGLIGKFLGHDDKTAVPAGTQLPVSERAFVEAVESFYTPYAEAPNDLQKSSLRTQRRNKLAEILPELQVRGWVGVIDSDGTTSEGKAYVTIRLGGGKNVKVMTWNNALSDVSASTLIGQDNPVYSALSHLKQGDSVKFDGTFLLDPVSRDYCWEASLTEEGSMTDPDFLMRFSEIEPAKP